MARRFVSLACLFVTACVSDTPSGTDSGTDTGTDTGVVTDGGGMPDVVGDSPPADAPSSWCSMNHPTATLCDDFDLSTMPRPEWSASGSGLSVTMGAPYKSSPHSLRSMGMASAFLSFTSASAPTTSTLEAEVQIVADGVSAANSPGLLVLTGESAQRLALTMIPNTNMGRCAYSGFSGGNTADFTMARGAIWHPVVLKISPAGNNYDLTCSVDGVDHGWKGLAAAALGKITFAVGNQGSSTGTMDAYYDNVAITAQ